MKHILSFLFLFCSFSSYSQIPGYDWARNGIDESEELGYSVAMDNNDNVYITGVFKDTFILGGETLISAGDFDIFVAKYDNTSTVIWAKRLGGEGADMSANIICDNSGMLYITGFITDTFQTDLGTIQTYGGQDILYAKYDNDGTPIWIKNYGGAGNDMGLQLGSTSTGNIILTGNYTDSTAYFDANPLYNAGSGDIFLLSTDNAGNISWLRRYGSSGPNMVNSISIDALDNIFMTGKYSGSMAFGSIVVSSINEGFVVGDIFVVKFDGIGLPVWARSIGGAKSWSSDAGVLNPVKVHIVDGENVVVGGTYFNCKLKPGVGSLQSDHAYNTTSFLIKYTFDGALSWSKVVGGNSTSQLKDIYAFGETIYAVGTVGSNAVFGTDTLPTFNNSADAFIVRYNTNGAYEGAKAMGGANAEIAYGIGGHGAVIAVTGSYSSAAPVFGADILTAHGGSNMFVVKFTESLSAKNILRSRSQIALYPNPVQNGKIYISQAPTEKYDITISDVAGRRVNYNLEKISHDELMIKLTDETPGLYIINIIDTFTGQMISKKLIVQ